MRSLMCYIDPKPQTPNARIEFNLAVVLDTYLQLPKLPDLVNLNGHNGGLPKVLGSHFLEGPVMWMS